LILDAVAHRCVFGKDT